MTVSRIISFLHLLPLCACATAPTAPPLERFEYVEAHMGVRTRIVLYAEDEGKARAAAGAAFGKIARLDGVMSDYRPDSELMRLCERAGRGPVGVSDDLFAVIARAVEISEATGGAFDITAGPAVGLWREARRTGQMPSADRIDAARELIGSHLIVLDSAARTVELRRPGMRLDLGGIGKGYAADRAAGVLRAEGVTRFLVALAGDIVLGDPPPGEEGWRIGAPGPTHGSGWALESEWGLGRGSSLSNVAVSTSGDIEQFVEIDGVRYSHIIDPRTGLGATHSAVVTVIAPDPATADALATALSIMDAREEAALRGRFPQVRWWRGEAEARPPDSP